MTVHIVFRGERHEGKDIMAVFDCHTKAKTYLEKYALEKNYVYNVRAALWEKRNGYNYLEIQDWEVE